MQVEPGGPGLKLVLTESDVYLLRRALERASFIDTPVGEQEEIATFCERVLEALGPSASPH